MLTATPITSGSGSTVDAYGYRYDPAGNRTIEQIQSAVTTSAYNILNQMTGRSGGGLLTITGTLDRPGTVHVSGTTYLTTGSNNAFAAIAPVVTGSNNIVISATNVNGYGVTKTLGVNVTGGTAIPSLSCDPDGNLVSDSTLTYGWDAANRLTTINYPSGAHSTFAYDGQGRRVRIIETGSSGGVTSTKNLVWEGMTIAEEKNASGTVTKRYFGQGVQLSGSNYYYTRDHLGSIRELTDTNGVVQAEYDYDPYGRQTQLSGTMTADFGFTGLYVHQPSGLDLAPYREYSATLGRWVNRDPSGEGSGINLYDYVANSPIIETDPLGLNPYQCCDAAARSAGERTLNQRYNSAVANDPGVKGVTPNLSTHSCYNLNGGVILPDLTPIPKCWTCNLEYRQAHWFSSAPDQWSIVCKGHDKSGNVVQEISFDVWHKRPAGEDPNNWFRKQYPYLSSDQEQFPVNTQTCQ